MKTPAMRVKRLQALRDRLRKIIAENANINHDLFALREDVNWSSLLERQLEQARRQMEEVEKSLMAGIEIELQEIEAQRRIAQSDWSPLPKAPTIEDTINRTIGGGVEPPEEEKP